MKKLAIFTEGGTEQHFVEKLLREIAHSKHVRIEKVKSRGGSTYPRITRRIQIDAASETQRYFVYIVDCGADGRVQSDIRDNYKKLCEQDFNAIIGVRDAYPKTGADLQKLKNNLYYGISTKPIRPTMVLAVQEVEAWFLAEHTHFERIDTVLTLGTVSGALGFDPSTGDVEARPHPSADLNTAYQLAGKTYEKIPAIIQRTVDALDYDQVYLALPGRVPGLKSLVDAVEDFLTN